MTEVPEGCGNAPSRRPLWRCKFAVVGHNKSYSRNTPAVALMGSRAPARSGVSGFMTSEPAAAASQWTKGSKSMSLWLLRQISAGPFPCCSPSGDHRVDLRIRIIGARQDSAGVPTVFCRMSGAVAGNLLWAQSVRGDWFDPAAHFILVMTDGAIGVVSDVDIACAFALQAVVAVCGPRPEQDD